MSINQAPLTAGLGLAKFLIACRTAGQPERFRPRFKPNSTQIAIEAFSLPQDTHEWEQEYTEQNNATAARKDMSIGEAIHLLPHQSVLDVDKVFLLCVTIITQVTFSFQKM